MPMWLRPAAVFAPASIIAVAVALIGCSQLQPMPADPRGRLFARGLDQIDDLYIVEVSNRRLALDAAARLAQLDPKLRVTETPGPHDETDIVLSYGEREVATYPNPPSDDPHVWGGWLGQLEADARQASPTLAADPQDEIDKALFDGIAGGLDRFSRYSTPQAARDQRAARDGFGGIGRIARRRHRPVSYHQNHSRQPGRCRRDPGRRPDRRRQRRADRQPLAERRDPPASRPDLEHGRDQRRQHRQARAAITNCSAP